MLFGIGEKSTSRENVIFKSYLTDNNIDHLLFFDSRSLTINESEFDDTYLMLTLKYLKENNMSYLAISRPKNLTVFATLYNFLKLNTTLKFKNLVTNLGFVDCTPKKQENLDDINSQIIQFSINDSELKVHDRYMLSSGIEETLGSYKYSIRYLKDFASFLDGLFDKIYFINTPIVDINLEMGRKRPTSFFRQLMETNAMLADIADFSGKSISIDVSSAVSTYDGVHFDKNGHRMVYEKIIESVKI